MADSIGIDHKSPKPMKFYKSRVFQVVSVIILLIIGYFVVDAYVVDRKYKENVKTATFNYEKVSVDSLTADLNLFYTSEGQYPRNIDGLKTFLEKKNLTTDTLVQITTKLKNFEYKVSGDYQTAQIGFTSNTGEKKTTEFNYKKDFH